MGHHVAPIRGPVAQGWRCCPRVSPRVAGGLGGAPPLGMLSNIPRIQRVNPVNPLKTHRGNLHYCSCLDGRQPNVCCWVINLGLGWGGVNRGVKPKKH
jgi:hypothetical protein